MLKDYLKILELMSFDESLFTKELSKTLKWLPAELHGEIKDWLILSKYTLKFPDTMKILNIA